MYRAYDEETARPVALKIVGGEVGVAPKEEARLSREGEVLRNLSHPGIVRVVASGVFDETGQPYLAMEWLEGEDLARRLAREPFTLEESVLFLRRAADALGAAHAQGIVHRDLKPS